jgi:hypothetical protein
MPGIFLDQVHIDRRYHRYLYVQAGNLDQAAHIVA